MLFLVPVGGIELGYFLVQGDVVHRLTMCTNESGRCGLNADLT